jgi:ubiquinone/menaquinone biosynthesis C-methylase UbiE
MVFLLIYKFQYSNMKWYDLFAGFYDNALEKLYFDGRKKAVDALKVANGQTVLDVACGTGANFKHLFATGKTFQLYATDFSAGMLKKAENRVQLAGYKNVRLLQADARTLSVETIEHYTGQPLTFDRILCVLGLSVIPDWEKVLDNLLGMLSGGGRLVVMDVFAEKQTFSTWLVERIARADLSRPIAQRLKEKTDHFSLEYQPVKESKVGGRLFIAGGTKR